MSTGRPGHLVILEARRGRENALAEFLASGLALAARESGIERWYAFRISSNRFGIYDTFVDSEARDAHLSGALAQALEAVTDDLLVRPAEIRPLDVVAAKPA